MRKGILAIILSVMMLISFTSCNDKNTALFNCEEAYQNILNDFYKVISDPAEEADYGNGTTGAWEAANVLGEDALDTIGYVYKDINNDGKEELLIGSFDTKEFGYVKNELYAAYTCSGEEAVLIFEGRSRNAYSLTDSDTFCYYGSNGAMYSILGEYILAEDGTLICKDFYFTYEKDEEWNEFGVFYNTIGEWNPDVSEELDISIDDFWKIHSELAEKTVKLDDIKFADFKAEKSEDLLFISTESDSEKYQNLQEGAEVISTPIVGNEDPVPIIISSLKDDLRLTVEMVDNGNVVEVYYDKEVSVGETIAVNAELSENNSSLRVTAVWSDVEGECKAEWYANYKNGEKKYSKYVRG